MLNKICAALLIIFALSAQAQERERMELKFVPSQENFNQRGASLREVFKSNMNGIIRAKTNNFSGSLLVSILLPFKSENSIEIVKQTIEAKENGYKVMPLSDETKTALDFYDGVILALDEIEASAESKLKLNVHFFDTWGNDSVINELLKEKEIANADVIIGPATHEGAKQIAEFCKQRGIINIQPFSPSKTIASNNRYHIKIAPTIDAHIDNIVRSLADSFMNEQIIVYTAAGSSNLYAANRLDSILRNFDGPKSSRFKSAFVNVSETNASKKRNLQGILSPIKKNVIVACVFDESNAQMVLRQAASFKNTIVMYGMPTWLNSEVLRLDYLNKLNTRFTEQFVPDDTLGNEKAMKFVELYRAQYSFFPPKYSWLGYDVINWLFKTADEREKFISGLSGSFYSGAGYKFQFRAVEGGQETDGKKRIEYFENTFLHLLRIEDYKLQKEW